MPVSIQPCCLKGKMMKKKTGILIAGDFCPINRTEEAILEGRSEQMIGDIKHHIEAADISVINLEAPLTDRGEPILKTGPNLIANPECVDFLVKSGFSLINTANNHILDYGQEGLFQTLGILDDNSLRHVGSGKNLSDACRAERFMTENGGVSFLAFAENEYTVAEADKGGACPVDIYENIIAIKKASVTGDFVIVMVHGGNEYNPIPSPGMKKRYRTYIEAGASAVIAMHTHCPQGYEMYKGCPIVYSLGNFLFDTPYKDREYKQDDFWWKGYMVRLEIDEGAFNSISFIPVDFGPDGTKVNEIKGEEKERFIEYLEYISKILVDDDEAMKYWKAWCLMKGEWWAGHFDKFSYPLDRNSRESLVSGLIIRNGLTCEAHNELLTTFWKMTAHGDTEGYTAYIDKLENLQKGILPKA